MGYAGLCISKILKILVNGKTGNRITSHRSYLYTYFVMKLSIRVEHIYTVNLIYRFQFLCTDMNFKKDESW